MDIEGLPSNIRKVEGSATAERILGGGHSKRVPGIFRQGVLDLVCFSLVSGAKVNLKKKKQNFQEVVFRQQNVTVY